MAVLSDKILRLAQRSSTPSSIPGYAQIYPKTDELWYVNGLRGEMPVLVKAVDDASGATIGYLGDLYGVEVADLRAALGNPAMRKWFYINCNGGGQNAAGHSVITIAGTPTNDTSVNTPGRLYTSAAVANSGAGLSSGAFNYFRLDQNVRLVFKFGNNINNNAVAAWKMWVGLFSATPTNVDTLGATHGFGFRFSTTATLSTEIEGFYSDGTTTFTEGGFSQTAFTGQTCVIEIANRRAFLTLNNNVVEMTGYIKNDVTNLGWAALAFTGAATAMTNSIQAVWGEAN